MDMDLQDLESDSVSNMNDLDAVISHEQLLSNREGSLLSLTHNISFRRNIYIYSGILVMFDKLCIFNSLFIHVRYYRPFIHLLTVLSFSDSLGKAAFISPSKRRAG